MLVVINTSRSRWDHNVHVILAAADTSVRWRTFATTVRWGEAVVATLRSLQRSEVVIERRLLICHAASSCALLVAVVIYMVAQALTTSAINISTSVQAEGMRLVVRAQAATIIVSMVGLMTWSGRHHAKLVSIVLRLLL